MKIFISWSGDRAKDAAHLLRDWLPTVIQQLDTPWVSDIDIESGSNWSSTIATELTGAKFGIVCVTKGNQDRPWLNFEAGAISRLVGGAVPLLIDFDKVEDLVGGPMSALQSRLPDRDGMTKLLSDLNARLDKSLDPPVLASAIDRAFDEFERKLAEINKQHDEAAKQVVPKRTDSDKIDELVNMMRDVHRRTPEPTLEQLLGGSEPARRYRAGGAGPRNRRVHGIPVTNSEQAKFIDLVTADLEQASIPHTLRWDNVTGALVVEAPSSWAPQISDLRGLLQKRSMETPWTLRIAVVQDDDYEDYGPGFNPDSP